MLFNFSSFFVAGKVQNCIDVYLYMFIYIYIDHLHIKGIDLDTNVLQLTILNGMVSIIKTFTSHEIKAQLFDLLVSYKMYRYV